MSFHHPLINQGKHRKPLLKIIYIELGSAELFSVHRQRVADVDPHSDDNDEKPPDFGQDKTKFPQELHHVFDEVAHINYSAGAI